MLLGSVPVGRFVYTWRALPAVQPVRFAVHERRIVVATRRDEKHAVAARRSVVAFQADDIDPVTGSGWTVTVVGHCGEVTEPAEVAELRSLGLRGWTDQPAPHFITVEPGIVTGSLLHQMDD